MWYAAFTRSSEGNRTANAPPQSTSEVHRPGPIRLITGRDQGRAAACGDKRLAHEAVGSASGGQVACDQGRDLCVLKGAASCQEHQPAGHPDHEQVDKPDEREPGA